MKNHYALFLALAKSQLDGVGVGVEVGVGRDGVVGDDSAALQLSVGIVMATEV